MTPLLVLLFSTISLVVSECPFIAKRDVSATIEEKCGAYGREQEAVLCAHGEKLKKSGLILKRGTPEFNHYMTMYADDKLSLYHSSLAVIAATLAYKDSMGAGYGKSSNNFLEYLLSQGYIAGPYKVCAPPVNCAHGYASRYRTFDGACNNVKYPRWGQAKTAFNRLLPPAYSDGVQAPRKSVTGYYLPYARKVSAILFDDKFRPDPLWTTLFMQFGQFISHDMSLAPSAHYGSNGIQCCTPDGNSVLPNKLLHHACYPIVIPYGDPFYAHYGQGCMNFVRTMTVAHPDCRLGPAEQMNAVTHWLDLSTLYGSDEDQAHALRAHYGGLLSYKYSYGHVVLPSTRGHEGYECDMNCPPGVCYKAGDTRVNQNLGLSSLHIIFLRFHNSVATALAHLNPQWDDEYLYQEARRICIAIYQHIVYNEYLPIALGWDFCVNHKIVSPKGQYGGGAEYNDYVSPNILNEHATGAFRYLHSTVHSYSELYDSYGNLNATTRLSDHFNCPAVLESGPHLLDYYVRGMCVKPMEMADKYYSREITWFLFKSNKPFGLDLESFDIQRSRDHGLRPYNDYRVMCGLPRAHTFADLLDVMSDETVSKLAHMYRHVDDLDLTVAFLEAHVKDAQFGPTMQCIAGEQFYRSRVGDRYFFEHRGMPHSFTDYQLSAIHKYSLAKLLCQHSDYMPQIQPEPFRIIYKNNPLVDCASLPGLDLAAWKSY